MTTEAKKYAHLGERVRELRERQKMTLTALADAIGTHKSYVWQIESGKIRFPQPDQLRAFALALGTSEADLLCAAGYMDLPHAVTADGLRLLRKFEKAPAHVRAGLEKMLEVAV